MASETEAGSYDLTRVLAALLSLNSFYHFLIDYL